MDAYSRPGVPFLRVPGIEERVDAVAVERLTPSRPAEALRIATSRGLLPSPLPLSRVGKAVELSVGPATPYRQEGKTKEREHLSACEPSLVWSNPNPLSFTRPARPVSESRDPPDRGFHVSVDLHQPMMQPLDRPRTCGIESHPLRHLFKTPQGVAWDSRVRNKNAYA